MINQAICGLLHIVSRTREVAASKLFALQTLHQTRLSNDSDVTTAALWTHYALIRLMSLLSSTAPATAYHPATCTCRTTSAA